MIRRGRRADGGWLNEVLIGVMGTRGDHVRLQLGRGCFRFDRQAGKEASKYIHTKKHKRKQPRVQPCPYFLAFLCLK